MTRSQSSNAFFCRWVLGVFLFLWAVKNKAVALAWQLREPALTHQGCGSHPCSGHIQESTNKGISKWNNKLMFLSPSKKKKLINKIFLKDQSCCEYSSGYYFVVMFSFFLGKDQEVELLGVG